MAESKKFYWIKLKTDFFNQETIDFLMSQPNGCQYVVLYQMLCLRTANNGGTLATNIGEMIVPYDVNKIVRDTKYFDFDTVTIALGLFKQLGLIYEGDENILKISNFELMVGSESASKEAERQRKSRAKRKALANENSIDHDKMSQKSVTKSDDTTVTNCHTEYRVKSIEYKSLDNRNKNVELLKQQPEFNFDEVVNLFNLLCPTLECVDKLTDTQKLKISRASAALKGDFESFFRRVEKSDFLTGRNGRWNINGTQANFDWIMNPKNMSKIQSGIYDNKESGNSGNFGSISDESLECFANLGTNL